MSYGKWILFVKFSTNRREIRVILKTVGKMIHHSYWEGVGTRQQGLASPLYPVPILLCCIDLKLIFILDTLSGIIDLLFVTIRYFPTFVLGLGRWLWSLSILYLVIIIWKLHWLDAVQHHISDFPMKVLMRSDNFLHPNGFCNDRTLLSWLAVLGKLMFTVNWRNLLMTYPYLCWVQFND